MGPAVWLFVVADQPPFALGSTMASGRASCADGLLGVMPKAECHTQPLSSSANPFWEGE